MKTTIEKELKEKGQIIYKNRGVSMWPIIRQDRDLIVIKTPTKKLQKYDVVLYKRGKNLVLHRIYKVNKDDYVMLGDNCIKKEYGIKEDQIIGILTEIDRKGKQIPIISRKYKMYLDIISNSDLLRYFLVRGRNLKWKIRSMF